MTWVNLSAAFGYGTNLTSTQQQQLRDNLAALGAGDAGAPTFTQAAIGANTSGQSELKTTSGSTNMLNKIHYSTRDMVLTYNFVIQGQNQIFSNYRITAIETNGSGGLLMSATTIHITAISGGGYSFYPTHRIQDDGSNWDVYITTPYVSASGETHWIFILEDKWTGKIGMIWEAPDHPCFGCGIRPDKLQQPFDNYNPDIHNLYIINPDQSQLDELFDKTLDMDGIKINSISDVIRNEYEIDKGENNKPRFPSMPLLCGFRGLNTLGDMLPYLGNFKHKKVEKIKRPMVKPDTAIMTKLRIK